MRRHSDLHQSAAISAVLLVLLFALPLAVVVPFQTELFSDDPIAVESEREPFQPGDLDGEMVLKVLAGDAVEEMTLGEYLVGVVRAEMPASFEEEALKAQAVAARTYALNKGPTDNHPDADLCTDYACCQAWISRADAQANWGDSAIEYTNKITAAVAETGNQVILYDGQLIDAVFHSSSASATQDAVEVWGNDVPYLQSVPSPEGSDVPNYESQVTLSAQEFQEAFLAARPEADLSGEPSTWVGEVQTTEGGSVHAVTIGGVTVTGAQARQIFNLRSAAFSVSYADGTFTFDVTGFGHGVGMSQYGADAMAVAGSTYTEILQHYYTGVTVEECPEEFLPQ